jgi:RNA polymerase sigma factor (sigma-70 family)
MGTFTTVDFRELFDRHRRELHVHCYRMLASFEEADDAVQETFLRAWRHQESFEPGTNPRAWLYRIATNTCLDTIRRNARRPPTASSEISWLQPYPDTLLDQVAPPDEQPDAVVVARETIELAYLAAIQLLPAKQRAVLLMRDVLDWSAAETAEMLDLSVASANSALQRARATLKTTTHRTATHGTATPGTAVRDAAARDAAADGTAMTDRRPATGLTDSEQELLARLIDAHERADVPAAVALLRKDVRVTMPPYPLVYTGIAALAPLLDRAFGAGAMGDWRLLPTRANRMPATASYLREPGATDFRAFKLDVVRAVDGKVAEFTTFDAKLFPQFGLPRVLAGL